MFFAFSDPNPMEIASSDNFVMLAKTLIRHGIRIDSPLTCLAATFNKGHFHLFEVMTKSSQGIRRHVRRLRELNLERPEVEAADANPAVARLIEAQARIDAKIGEYLRHPLNLKDLCRITLKDHGFCKNVDEEAVGFGYLAEKLLGPFLRYEMIDL